MKHSPLVSHLRDELGITEATNARPVQAALASAASFTVGAALPLCIALLTMTIHPAWFICLGSLGALALTGGLAARVGGASVWKGSVRVVFWGAFAMAVTAGIGAMLGNHSF